MIAGCDAAISLGGRPLRALLSLFFFMALILTERIVKSIDTSAAAIYYKTKRKGKLMVAPEG